MTAVATLSVVLAHGSLHVLEVVGLVVGLLLPFLALGVVVTVVRRRDD